MIHSSKNSVRRSAGFTLIEIITVVGIIALLMAIALPMLLKAISSAGRIKTAADLSVIGSALEEYKKDHGQYPQVGQVNTGFAVLARELVGVYGDGFLPGSSSTTPDDPNDPPPFVAGKEYKPGDSVGGGPGPQYVALVENTGGGGGTSNARNWALFNPHDGLDGPGGKSGGKKSIAYLQPEKIRIRGSAILDANDKPILYFPARPGNLNLSIGTAYVSSGGVSKYNADDNIEFFTRFDDASMPNALNRIRVMLGDTNADGKIDPGEGAATTNPYILWAGGPDGFYGPKTTPSAVTPTATDVSKCDDVLSFK